MSINRNRAITLVGSIGAVLALTVTTAFAAVTARDVTDSCAGAEDGGFSDVTTSNVHKPMIDCIKHHEITSGKTATTYDPGGNLTKEQLATFLVNTVDAAAGGTGYAWNWDNDAHASYQKDYFTDDAGTHEANINRLAAQGTPPIIPNDGSGSQTFSPKTIASRALMAQFTAAAVEAVTTQNIAGAQGPRDCFEDDDSLPTLQQNAINLLAHAGVVTGTGETTFSPANTLRRDQMATFLARAYDIIANANDNGGTPDANDQFSVGGCPAA